MATFSFVAMATSVWECGIFSMNQGLVSGGRAGVMWSTVIHAIGFVPIVLSMAEMSSIAPTAGSQYHWVSEFAPRAQSKFLSYIVGWLAALGWQALVATTAYSSAVIILSMASIYHPEYAMQNW